MASPLPAPLGRGLTEAPSAPGVAAPTPWPVPTSAVVGPGTDGAVALTGPQLARSGQSRRFRAALMSRSTTSPVSGHTRCLSILPLPIRRHRVPSGVAQPWWIWLEANQRSATVRLPPWRAVLLDQLRPNQSHRSIRDGPAKRSPAHALCHGGHVEILDHDAAVGARQLGGEPVAASRLRCTQRRSRRTSLAFRVAPSS